MNKYLSIEEQQAFWTELFSVTIRYEQRRGGAMEACLDLFSREGQSASRPINHLHRFNESFRSPPINHRPPNDGGDDGGDDILRNSNPDNRRGDSRRVGDSNNIRTRDHSSRPHNSRARNNQVGRQRLR
jgi:hypothetical protein